MLASSLPPPSGAAAPMAGARLGRFELRRPLGEGAQATVWLAHDPQLQREVALKVARAATGRADDDAPGGWRREARSVSRLTHPGVVPLFECFAHEGVPCLVFEYVPGETLARRLRRQGALPVRLAVSIARDIAEALEAAHAAGVVHRDLKPSNVLIDPDGRVRVMDFGIAAPIAARRHDGADRHIAGTPGYMSPEAARGEPPHPAMDLFAIGLVLGEMLAGRRLLDERDPQRALQRVQQEDLDLPDALGAEVDEALRALVRRALAREPARRWDSAAALREALAQWLEPPADAAGDSAGHGTLEFLLRRMRLKSDFPALSSSMVRIQCLATSDSGNLHSLSEEVLRDVALTQKLLRLVNAASYRHVGAGSITTVSRAISLLGFATIRNLSMSLVLLEHLKDRAQADHLRDQLLQALLAGHVAGELAAGARDAEEVFVGAMFQNLGRLLCGYYLPDEAAQVRQRLGASAGGAAAVATAAEEARASAAVLGLSFEALGLGVARHWGMPEALQRCMVRPAGGLAEMRPARDGSPWCAVVANEVAHALVQPDEARRAQGLRAVMQAVSAAGERPRTVEEAIVRAGLRLRDWTRSTGVRLPSGAPLARWLAGLAGPGESAADDRSTGPAPWPPAGAVPDSVPGAIAPAADDRTELLTTTPARSRALSDGIERLAESLAADRIELSAVLRDALETMQQALGLRRVVFCLRDPREEALLGRLAAGEAPAPLVASFRVALRARPGDVPDLFTAVCLKGVDSVIADATAPNVAARLPGWFSRPLLAPSFLLLPIQVKHAPVALIYADRAHGAIEIAERDLRLVRTLRNQMAMALRQPR